jgi:hypothetical protein
MGAAWWRAEWTGQHHPASAERAARQATAIAPPNPPPHLNTPPPLPLTSNPQVGPRRRAQPQPGPCLQRHVHRLHPGAGPLPPHDRGARVALGLLHLWQHGGGVVHGVAQLGGVDAAGGPQHLGRGEGARGRGRRLCARGGEGARGSVAQPGWWRGSETPAPAPPHIPHPHPLRKKRPTSRPTPAAAPRPAASRGASSSRARRSGPSSSATSATTGAPSSCSPGCPHTTTKSSGWT